MSQPMVALGELTEIFSGFAFKSELFNSDGAGLPLVRIRDVRPGASQTYYNGAFQERFVVNNGDLLVGMDGEFNCAPWAGGRALLNQRVCRITAKSGKLDQAYLNRFLPAALKEIEDKTNFVTVKHLSGKQIANIKIPLPSLPEQRRIAGILDQANALRRLRRQSLSRFSNLGQAIFYEMFGDTKQERSSAFNATVGDVCSVSSGATPSRKVDGYYGGLIPWVKTTEVKGEPISSVEEFLTEAGRAAARLKTYPPKTILVAMYGQGRTRGNVGYLTFPATVNQACAALQCNEKCLPEFMFFQLKSSYERLRRLGQGGNQPNLNGEIVRSFPIVLPTIERQNAFLKVFEEIRATENQLRDHERQAESLFSSLQHRAFLEEL